MLRAVVLVPLQGWGCSCAAVVALAESPDMVVVVVGAVRLLLLLFPAGCRLLTAPVAVEHGVAAVTAAVGAWPAKQVAVDVCR